MHLKIFVLARDLEDIEQSYEAITEMDAASIDADYIVAETEEEEFKNSVEWLKGYYGLKNAEIKKTDTEVGEIPIAILDRKEFFDALEAKVKERIPKVQEALQKEDLWLAAYYAYNEKGFYFYLYEESGIMNEVDLHHFYKESKTLGDKLYIVRTYDYHY